MSNTQRMSPHRGEEIEQARVVRWSHLPAVRTLLPELEWLFHVPNGGRRDSFTGGQMKALGAVPGVPDLMLPVRTYTAPGLVIEMKSGTGRLSLDQRRWSHFFIHQGWAWHVARSAEEARIALCQYLGRLAGEVPPLP